MSDELRLAVSEELVHLLEMLGLPVGHATSGERGTDVCRRDLAHRDLAAQQLGRESGDLGVCHRTRAGEFQDRGVPVVRQKHPGGDLADIAGIDEADAGSRDRVGHHAGRLQPRNQLLADQNLHERIGPQDDEGLTAVLQDALDLPVLTARVRSIRSDRRARSRQFDDAGSAAPCLADDAQLEVGHREAVRRHQQHRVDALHGGGQHSRFAKIAGPDVDTLAPQVPGAGSVADQHPRGRPGAVKAVHHVGAHVAGRTENQHGHPDSSVSYSLRYILHGRTAGHAAQAAVLTARSRAPRADR